MLQALSSLLVPCLDAEISLSRRQLFSCVLIQSLGHKPSPLGFRPCLPWLFYIWSFESIGFSLVPSCGKMQDCGLKWFTGWTEAAIGKEVTLLGICLLGRTGGIRNNLTLQKRDAMEDLMVSFSSLFISGLLTNLMRYLIQAFVCRWLTSFALKQPLKI